MPVQPFWFPAKRRGWGWAPPTVWQGWAVLIAFFAAVLAGVAWVLPRGGPGGFLAYSGFLCVLLLAVCWFKGEPPRWK
jgi:hypothetical protein